MAKNDGGPAFGHGDHEHGGHPGMSLRDYFAGQALAGMISDKLMVTFTKANDPAEHIKTIARSCYVFADTMLEARDE